MLSYGDYFGSSEDEFIDTEAEEVEDAMDDLIHDNGSDIDAVIGDEEIDPDDADDDDEDDSCEEDEENADYIDYVIDDEEEE